jgi:ketosteroid isomerase-like protein
MSRNADAWRELAERVNAGELGDLSEIVDPDLVYHMRPDEPDARTFTGLAEYERLFATWTEAFEEFRVELHELLERGDAVIAVTTLHGRGRGSGAEVHEPYVFVTTYRDGRAIETFEYHTKDEALASLG